MCVPLWELASGRTPRHATTAKVLLGLISVSCVSSSSENSWSQCLGRMSKAYRDRHRWRSETRPETMVAGGRLRGEAPLSVKTFLTLCRQKVRITAHNTGIDERKQPAYSTCLYYETKIQKQIHLFVFCFKHPPFQLGASDYMYWRMMWFWIAFKFRTVQTIEPSSPIIHQLPASPLPTCLISPSSLGKKW